MLGVDARHDRKCLVRFARIVWNGNPHYSFLIWNLFLACWPLLFALLAREIFGGTTKVVAVVWTVGAGSCSFRMRLYPDRTCFT